MEYDIVTSAKDEERFIVNTLESVINQTVLPNRWVIVDDGSSDGTLNIWQEYASRYPWITVLSSNSRETRQEGPPIIRAFYTGYETIKTEPWDFIVKLDADLSLPKDYFASVMACFEKDSAIGLCGGYCVTYENGKKIRERHASYHIRGPIKSVRRACWNDIGGFKAVMGWDGLDEMTAMYMGWKTKNIEKEVIHWRPTFSSYEPRKLAYQIGYSRYRNGSNLFLIFIRTMKRLSRRPVGLYALFYLYGYCCARMRQEEKNVSPELKKFINRFHMRRLFRWDLR